MCATPRLKWSLVEECLEEAEFLWGKRERALDAHDENLEHVSHWTERRLLAALDGLALGGDDVVAPLLEPALAQENRQRISVAAYVLASLATPAALAVLAQTVATNPGLPGLRPGLELAASDLLLERLATTVGESSAAVVTLLTDVRAFQGMDAGGRLRRLLLSNDEDVQAAAVRLARSSSMDAARDVAGWGLQMKQPEIRIEAMELGLIVGLAGAKAAALDIVTRAEPGFLRAAVALATTGHTHEHEVLIGVVADKVLERDALFALGFAGTTVAADACLAAMKAGQLPRVAAESFCCVTGLDLERERLVVSNPIDTAEPVSFDDDDLEADLVPTADESLPMPDVIGVERWWGQQRKRFTDGERYVDGRPLSLAALHARLTNGPMRRRHGWAFEVAVHTRGSCRINTRGLTRTQRSQLDLLAESVARSGNRSVPTASRRAGTHAPI